jgi:hypothetical protein
MLSKLDLGPLAAVWSEKEYFRLLPATWINLTAVTDCKLMIMLRHQ